MMQYAPLAIAIVAEVAATLLLPLTSGFTKLLPCLGVLAGYAAAFYFLSLALQVVPVAIAYALWSGLGTALVTVLSWLVHKQPMTAQHIVGIALIVAGSIVTQR